MNQQIKLMGCNRWEFQDLHRLRKLKQLAQEESDTKWKDLVLSCKADKRVPSILWQQMRQLRDNEQEEDKGVKDRNRLKRQRRSLKTVLKRYLQNSIRR